MNVLITGITGFAGSHLADYILANHRDVKVFGTMRHRSRTENIEQLKGKAEFIECDLTDYTATKRAIDIATPSRIFHLAANSYVPDSWKMPAEVLYNNIVSQTNLFEAVRDSKFCKRFGTRIQIAGSSEEYGLVKSNEVPINELNEIRPLSAYGVSKVAQDFLGYQYCQSYGMKIIRTRAFNHTGPRRGEMFVCSTFAKQIAEIENGSKDGFIQVGNLEALRDFTDVRDMVRAYWQILDKGKFGDVYNIGSGKMRTMREVLDMLLALSSFRIEKVIDVNRLRPSDVEILVCDNTKLCKLTGWKPEIEFKQTLQDLLDYWRRRV